MVNSDGSGLREIFKIDDPEIRLHFSTCHLHPDCQWQRAAFIHRIDVGADDFNLTVADLVQSHRSNKLKGRRHVPAELGCVREQPPQVAVVEGRVIDAVMAALPAVVLP